MSTIAIRNGLIVTQDAKRRVITGDVVVRDDRIESVGAAADKSDIVIDAGHSIVMPGLVNTHTHVGMSILRGLAPNDSLDAFLKKTFEFDAKNTEEMIAVSTLLGTLEMLRTGTTSFLDLYYAEDVVAEAVHGTGMRAFLSWVALDKEFTTQKGVPIRNAEKFVKEYKGKGLITPSFGLQGVYVCSKDTIAEADELSEKCGTLLHMHLSETQREVDEHAKKHGKRPAEWMQSNSFLSGRLVAAHCVWMNDAEVAAFARSGANVSYNPVSNAKLRSGTADVQKMLKRKVNVALGTDSTASNDSLDMFQTMKFGALTSGLPAQDILDMATVNGAKALGSGSGAIEEGRKADIILIDRRQTLAAPSLKGNVVNNLVYSIDGKSVTTSIIDGKIALERGVAASKKFLGVFEKAERLAAALG